ncbi:hypothetical protein ASZ90_004698 [hydrocarbon metagenome]|uniref:Uncharacterized protein n=1 Tax=hydrocarbon metagenome TaxID=938273 RepID=A0A0W8FX19_9ZZZZ
MLIKSRLIRAKEYKLVIKKISRLKNSLQKRVGHGLMFVIYAM